MEEIINNVLRILKNRTTILFIIGLVCAFVASYILETSQTFHLFGIFTAILAGLLFAGAITFFFYDNFEG